MTYIPLTGASSGGSKPSNWTVRERLRNITKALTAGSSLDLRFAEKFFYQQDNLYPAMELMATHSRTSSAWYPNWDFKSGSEVGRLVEYGADERRYGDYGALDEGASTNQTSNARLEGAVVGVVGAGGAVPTGLTNAQGPATLEVLGSGVESGWPYVELEYTTTGSAFPQLYFGTLSSYSAASGETWTTSCGLRLLDSSGGFLGLQVKMREYDGVTITNDTLNSAYVAADSAHRRFKHTATLTGGTTDNALGGLLLGFSGAGFARFRLYVPQFEEAADATSPILPTAGTPAAATRAADIVTGVTTDRASRGWYDTQWDYTNGGVCGDLLEFLPGVPRVGPKGLLVEEGTTNQIRNPRCEGAVAGTPGTLPTNWTGAAITEVVGSGQEEGWHYVDVRYAATPGSSVSLLTLESTFIVSGSGVDWALSAGFRVVGGSTDNINGFRLRLFQFSAVPAFLSAVQGPQFLPDAQHRRYHGLITTNNASTASVKPEIVLETVGGAIDITLRIYAPQLEQSATPTSPILPTVGTPAAATRAADVVTGVTTDRASRGWYDTQWDYTDGGPVGDLLEFLPGVPRVGPKGLLVEEGSTNHIRNPRAEGAVAGAPGTLPTNWTFSMPGITHEVVGSGVANGKPYIDLKFAGTPTGDGFLYYESSTVVSAASGQTWTLAVDISVVDGDLSNMDGIRIVLTERTSVGGNNGQNSSVEKTPDALPRRFYHTVTLSNGTTAHVQPMMELEWTGSGNIDFTLRLSVPSLEQKAYPTSVVLPEAGSPAAATRAADDIERGNGDWASDTSFSVFGEFVLNTVAQDGSPFSIASGGSDRTDILACEGGDLKFRYRSNSVTDASQIIRSAQVAETVRSAIGVDAAEVAVSVSGAATQTYTPTDVLPGASLSFGKAWPSAATAGSFFIKSARYWPYRFSNSELEALVA